VFGWARSCSGILNLLPARLVSTRTPRLEVTALFDIADRRLRDVTLEGGRDGDASFKECLLGVLRRLDFSGVPGPPTFTASSPFKFQPTAE
jgi:hypothetical protein